MQKLIYCLVIVIFFTISYVTHAAQHFADYVFAEDSCKRCDLEIVKEVELRLDNLPKPVLRKFLCSFGVECGTNIEYSEYSNEMLFRVLERYPGEVIKAMKGREVQRAYIYKRLSEPLVYEHIDSLKSIVSKSKGNYHVKKEIVDALAKAK